MRLVEATVGATSLCCELDRVTSIWIDTRHRCVVVVLRQRSQGGHPGLHLNQHVNPPGSLPVALHCQKR